MRLRVLSVVAAALFFRPCQLAPKPECSQSMRVALPGQNASRIATPVYPGDIADHVVELFGSSDPEPFACAAK